MVFPTDFASSISPAANSSPPSFCGSAQNNKIPALIDADTYLGPVELFESGAILNYLAEKTGRFMPADPRARHRCLTWLFWQVGGLGPIAGQAHHFRAFAPEQVPYAIRRYTDEVNRLYGVLNRALSHREWLADTYSIADIACYPWIIPHERQGQRLEDFPHLQRWFEAMAHRPGVARGLARGNELAADALGHTFLYGQTAAAVNEHESSQGATAESASGRP